MAQIIPEPVDPTAVYLAYRVYDEWVFMPVVLGASVAAIDAGVRTTVERDRRATR